MISGRKKVAFAAAVLAVFFGLLEAAARLLGLGDPDAFGGSHFKYQWIYPPLLRATRDGAAFRPTDVRLVDRAVPRRGPRVLVFGESAVSGLGFSENASFPRALERRLIAAGSVVPVVDCAIPCVASHQVWLIEKDVVKTLGGNARGDAFVFHVGNNEFFVKNAERYAETHGGLSLTYRIDRLFTVSRFYVALKNLSRRSYDVLTPVVRDSLEPVALSDEEVAAIVSEHAGHMRLMVETAREAGATPVLMTVATNLEFAPTEDEKPANPLVARWRERFSRGLALRREGKMAGARAELVRAKEEDPLRLRCREAMNENVRRLASELGVALCDGEASLARVASDGITGFSLMYDHVHFTPAGSERLAQALHATLSGAGVVPALPDSEGYVNRRLAALDSAATDSLLVTEWLGWNDDRAFLSRKDCWKLVAARNELQKKVDAGKASAEELVWCANAYALDVDGEPQARALYAKARALKPSLSTEIEANLAWLDARPR